MLGGGRGLLSLPLSRASSWTVFGLSFPRWGSGVFFIFYFFKVDHLLRGVRRPKIHLCWMDRRGSGVLGPVYAGMCHIPSLLWPCDWASLSLFRPLCCRFPLQPDRGVRFSASWRPRALVFGQRGVLRHLLRDGVQPTEGSRFQDRRLSLGAAELALRNAMFREAALQLAREGVRSFQRYRDSRRRAAKKASRLARETVRSFGPKKNSRDASRETSLMLLCSAAPKRRLRLGPEKCRAREAGLHHYKGQ